jgi:oligosaccharide repeat unit polymerase
MDNFAPISAAPAFLVLIAVACLIALDCRRDLRQLVSARNVFLLTITAWFLLEACLLPNAIKRYNQSEHLFGLLCVSLCVGSFLAGYSGSNGRVFDGLFRRLVSIESPRLIWGVFLFAIFVGFLPLVVIAKGDVRLILEDAFVSKGRWSSVFQRGRFGGARDAFLELQLFLRAAMPLAAAILVQKKQGSERKLVVGFFFVFMLARAFNSGARSGVIEVLLPLAAAIYWRLNAEMKRRALLFGLPAILVVGLAWSAASVVGRNKGTLDWEGGMEADYIGFEMFRELLYLQRAIPSRGDYQWGYTYFVQLVNPIPRFLWPGKPSGDAGLQLAEMQGAIQNGQIYLTSSPGLIGEMYWNGGLLCIGLMSALFGYLAKSWDRSRRIASQSILSFTVFAAGLAIIFISGRSINMAASYGMLGLFAILMLFSRRARRILPVSHGSATSSFVADRSTPDLRLPGSR